MIAVALVACTPEAPAAGRVRVDLTALDDDAAPLDGHVGLRCASGFQASVQSLRGRAVFDGVPLGEPCALSLDGFEGSTLALGDALGGHRYRCAVVGRTSVCKVGGAWPPPGIPVDALTGDLAVTVWGAHGAVFTLDGVQAAEFDRTSWKWSRELVAGPHALVLVDPTTGERLERVIDVPVNGTAEFCWDYHHTAACSPR